MPFAQNPPSFAGDMLPKIFHVRPCSDLSLDPINLQNLVSSSETSWSSSTKVWQNLLPASDSKTLYQLIVWDARTHWWIHNPKT